MTISIKALSSDSAVLQVGGLDRLKINSDGTLEALNSPDLSDAPDKTLVTVDHLLQAAGMPRFSVFLWTGKAQAMPDGCIQSSGQQVPDLMYPDMREHVLATQHTCTEADWQADPYKRVTHWSLGDGASWMRTPDKNGVQAGNVGGFYGAGSNPVGDLNGTAVGDAGRNLTGSFGLSRRGTSTEGYIPVSSAAGVFEKSKNATGSSWNAEAIESKNDVSPGVVFNASRQWPVADEFRPRTFYGIWMIRMYGRIVNTGSLDYGQLNARMDLIDSRINDIDVTLKNTGTKYAEYSIPGVYEFIVPEVLKSGKRMAQVYLTAGGDSGLAGAAAVGGYGAGSAGNGGMTAWMQVDFTGIERLTITVGAGGKETTSTVDKNFGGASSLGDLVTVSERVDIYIKDRNVIRDYIRLEGGRGRPSFLNGTANPYGGQGGQSFWNEGGCPGGGGPGIGYRGSGGGGGTLIGAAGGDGYCVILI